MIMHRRKILDSYFQDVKSGKKTFEIREKRESIFWVHDILILENTLTNEELKVKIVTLYEGELGGLLPGWVVLGIRVI